MRRTTAKALVLVSYLLFMAYIVYVEDIVKPLFQQGASSDEIFETLRLHAFYLFVSMVVAMLLGKLLRCAECRRFADSYPWPPETCSSCGAKHQ